MKVNSTIYKGIEYVQVSVLPADQQEKIQQTINRDLLIKIIVDGKLVGNCLQFKDYELWFDNVYKATQTNQVKAKKGIKEEAKKSIVQMGALKKA